MGHVHFPTRCPKIRSVWLPNKRDAALWASGPALVVVGKSTSLSASSRVYGVFRQAVEAHSGAVKAKCALSRNAVNRSMNAVSHDLETKAPEAVLGNMGLVQECLNARDQSGRAWEQRSVASNP